MKKRMILVLSLCLTVTLLSACKGASQSPSKKETKELVYEQWVSNYMDQLNDTYEQMTDQFISDGNGAILQNAKLAKTAETFDKVVQEGLSHQDVPAAYAKADKHLKSGLKSFAKVKNNIDQLLKHPEDEELFIACTDNLQDGLKKTKSFISEVAKVQEKR
ncbi:hypothetical protein [Bacillus sp. NPDC077027]|uniref:hypothetical protein n=1 Tax=Bacillus sp. NPDC077027 TaxID=3390548 RepID=UPI003D060652